jgi:hypothetical protein
MARTRIGDPHARQHDGIRCPLDQQGTVAPAFLRRGQEIMAIETLTAQVQ